MHQLQNANKIVDPCAGGGNFLVECLEFMCAQCNETKNNFLQKVIWNVTKLYGYDIDRHITRIALVNIRLRVLAILNHKNEEISFEIWEYICPNIFRSLQSDDICGALSTDNQTVVNILNGNKTSIDSALGNADIILTNPPFATIKGMLSEQKVFLKKNYPDANCDMCVSFFDAIYKMLKPKGICGIVSQNSWMHLKTFKKIRERITSQYCIYKIVNLGAGAFQDLSGEKSNVSLLILGKEFIHDNMIGVLNLNELSFREKIKSITTEKKYIYLPQKEINNINGYDFTEKGTLNSIRLNKELYKDIAVPMQGTSTGNAEELVGYFWEHFNDSDWVMVSNGGGYCRWQGLNNRVVKWGKDSEYIKNQKGSALRNVKYFPVTQMVYSDTGTAGLNVRVLLDNQIFIASGPGIRIIKGTIGECAYLIHGSTDIDLDKLDTYIAKLADTSCSLKRTKTSKNSLGCDGFLEYVSKDLHINPEIIVKKIQENPLAMKTMLEKYQNMILHNTVLYYLGYNISTGILVNSCKLEEIIDFLTKKFGETLEFRTWINQSFNLIHKEIFKGIPYLVYENGVIQKV